MLGMVPIDIHVSDTYFVVAHIHFVLFGGSVFTIFAGIYHWFPKMTGRMYDERLGRVHFWLTLVGMLGTFVPMHWIGMEGMPRRVADYAAQFGDWNLVISVSALHPRRRPARLPLQHGRLLALRARRPTANPWRAKTIEWQVSSPPPIFNFDEIPRVVGGPYEFGVPGARHAIMAGEEAEVAQARARRRRRAPGPAARRRAVARDRGRARQLPDRRPAHDRGLGRGGTVLAFLNEVAGGRKLLEAVRERVEAGADAVAVVAPAEPARRRADRRPRRDPRRGPEPGRGHPGGPRRVRHRGRRRGLDPEPSLALDDAVRAFEPREILLSCLLRDPLRPPAPRPGRVGAAALRGAGDAHPGPRRRRRGPLGPHPHPGRRHPDGRQPRPARAAQGAGRRSARTATRSSARARATSSREEVCARLARTLAELYRADIDATGQPMSPEPLAGDRERDRALPDRRHPDLDPRRASSRAGSRRA